MENETPRGRPGPVPGPETKKYTLLIEPELAEWGKTQPGGLSELTRRLLKAERRRLEDREEVGRRLREAAADPAIQEYYNDPNR